MFYKVGDDYLDSRMKKYYDNDEQIGVLSRTKRNEELYQDIRERDLDNINIESNAHVIGDNDNNIDIAKIKELLEKKYQVEPKKTRIVTEENDYEDNLTIEATKEYDINSLINKAKKNQPEDYERERFKRIHDTQYDILKSLNLDEKTKTPQNEDLVNLINTINENELTKEVDPLDILTDLKGSENTVVLNGIKEEEQKEEIKEEVKEELKKEIDKSFFTNSMTFTQSDFDDFNDLKEDVESNKLLIKALLLIVVLALIAGIVVLVNSIFNLHWF